MWSARRAHVYRLGITVLHSYKGGAPVLKGDASWRTVDGLLVNTSWVHFILSRSGI